MILNPRKSFKDELMVPIMNQNRKEEAKQTKGYVRSTTIHISDDDSK